MHIWLVPIALFASLVLVAGQVTRLLSNISLNRSLREALRSHPPSVPLLADKLDSRQPWADALIGWIFLAFAFGLALVALLETGDERREILQAAIVPLTVGLVVLAFVRWAKSAAEDHGTRAAPPAAPVPPVAPAAPAAPRPPRRPRASRGSGA